MMRATLLLLLLANVGYFAWTQGHLAGMAGAGSWSDPATQSEPLRVAQQVQPDRLTVLGAATVQPDTAQDAVATDSEQTSCLQLKPLTDAQADVLQTALANELPDGSLKVETTIQPARWVVYLGKFSGSEALLARKAELRAANFEYRDIANPALQPGIVLGTFISEAAATQGQQDLSRKGIKAGKVVVERPEFRLHALTLPQATPAQQEKVGKVSAELLGNASLIWQACGG